jgi:hypothetical protein
MRLCSDSDSDSDLEEGGAIKIENLITILILIHLTSITSTTNTIIWGLGRKRRVAVVTRRHRRFVCRAQFLVLVVPMLMLVLPWV